MNLLPAVLIGGPPNAGKSVLLYNLTQALYERDVPHHAIRACPDGEGNWFQEGNPATVELIREDNKRHWSRDFIQRMSLDLEHRCLPFLVDIGGSPRSTDLPLLQQCTHSVLLLRSDQPDSIETWQYLVTETNLLPLAQLFSRLDGSSVVTAQTPFLSGKITGLVRQSQAVRNDPVFIELVDQIAALFAAYSSQDRERVFLEQAPTEIVMHLPDELHAFTTTSINWQPEMLIPFLNSVPEQTPLSVHGYGPNWLYAALMAHAGQQAFYQFDPKIPFGWIQPLGVYFGEERSNELAIEMQTYQDVAVLSIAFPQNRIEYFQPDPLAFPRVDEERGLILDGPLPYWLLTALVRLYQQAGVAWIAPHHAQQNVHGQQKTAIVVSSRVSMRHIGDLITFPA